MILPPCRSSPSACATLVSVDGQPNVEGRIDRAQSTGEISQGAEEAARLSWLRFRWVDFSVSVWQGLFWATTSVTVVRCQLGK